MIRYQLVEMRTIFHMIVIRCKKKLFYLYNYFKMASYYLEYSILQTNKIFSKNNLYIS